MFYIYLSPRVIPAKYLVVGTLFLIGFQIVPIIYTVTTAFTNFGDGHRGQQTGRHRGDRERVRHPGAGLRPSTSSRSRTDPAGDLVFLLDRPERRGLRRTPPTG